MVGQELKFLRSLLDWTQTTLGKHMGYKDAQMVAKWEKARHTPIPVQVDTFVRAAYREKIGEHPVAGDRHNQIRDQTRSTLGGRSDGTRGSKGRSQSDGIV
jgi:transcriptional regulator with XRE-family HTH domain